MTLVERPGRVEQVLVLIAVVRFNPSMAVSTLVLPFVWQCRRLCFEPLAYRSFVAFLVVPSSPLVTLLLTQVLSRGV